MRGARILLLEDDRDTRWALATVLRQEGVEVTEAADGREGLALLARAQFDLVISDVSMPGLGGFGVFAALRFGDGERFEAHKGMPMMIVSGRASRGELARALDAGVDEFMIKPVDPDEFKARVRTLLRRSRRATPPAARTSGDLRDFGMRSLGQALHTAGRTARLMVQSGDRCGLLDFLNGRIVHAEFEGPGVQDRGETAAVDVLAMEDGVFQITGIPSTVIRSVFSDTEPLLLRACARADESKSTSREVDLSRMRRDSTTSEYGSREGDSRNMRRSPTTSEYGAREVSRDISTGAFRREKAPGEIASREIRTQRPRRTATTPLGPRSRPLRDDAPTTGRVFENGGAGTQEIALEAMLAANERPGEQLDRPEPDGDRHPGSQEPSSTPLNEAADPSAPSQRPAEPGSVLQTARDAGAFDLDELDEEMPESQDRRQLRGRTAQVLGGALNPAELFADEATDSSLDVTN